MILMTKLENIVIRWTGCNRAVANEIVNEIIDEWEKDEETQNESKI